jgi:hypothetical protein
MRAIVQRRHLATQRWTVLQSERLAHCIKKASFAPKMVVSTADRATPQKSNGLADARWLAARVMLDVAEGRIVCAAR